MNEPKRYRCYGKDDLGHEYDAMAYEDPDGDWIRLADFDALYSTAIFNRKRYEEAESRIRKLEAALHEIRDADCRGEVCKGIACVALNVAYPTQDRGGEPAWDGLTCPVCGKRSCNCGPGDTI